MERSGDDSRLPRSRRIRDRLTHWLSFFRPKKSPSSQGGGARAIVLTNEKRQRPDNGLLKGDQDCACE